MTRSKLELDMLDMAAAQHDQAIEACYGNARDREPMICGCCNGSGEGRTDGSTCGACRGSGEFRDAEAEREREAERADYLYDQAKDRDLERALDNECYPDDDLPF